MIEYGPEQLKDKARGEEDKFYLILCQDNEGREYSVSTGPEDNYKETLSSLEKDLAGILTVLRIYKEINKLCAEAIAEDIGYLNEGRVTDDCKYLKNPKTVPEDLDKLLLKKPNTI